MKAIANLAISSGFFAILLQFLFWVLRSETTLQPRISWFGAYACSSCVLLMIGSITAMMGKTR